MTNYNVLGQEYVSSGSAKPWSSYGVLDQKTEQHCIAIRRLIDRSLDSGGEALKISPTALFMRLDAVFLHYSSALQHLQASMAESRAVAAVEKPPIMMVIAAKELSFELEAVLFRAAACLDSLANYLSQTLSGFQMPARKDGRRQEVYFSNLKNGLKNSVGSDARTAAILPLLEMCEPAFHDLLLSIGRKTVRNFVAHQSGIQELTGSNFIAHGLEDGRYLRLDQDLEGIPLVGSIYDLVGNITFLIYQVARVLSTLQSDGTTDLIKAIELSKTPHFYSPQWRPTLVSWRDFESADNEQLDLTVALVKDRGFELRNVKLDPEILNHATND